MKRTHAAVAVSLSAALLLGTPTISWAINPGSSIDGGGSTAAAPEEEYLETPLYQGDLEASQWMLAVTRSSEANKVSTGEGITVAVLSDGIDGLHPELTGRVLPGYDATTRKSFNAFSNEYVSSGAYGTYVAAIIAANNDGAGMRGIAPEAKILPVIMESESQYASDATTAHAIRYAAEHGAKIIVVPTSTDEESRESCEAITYAHTRGSIVFTNSSNDYLGRIPPYFIGKCKDAVAVGAVAHTLGEVGHGSNNAVPMFVAPVENTVSAIRSFGNWYPYYTSTRQEWAAPIAAGIAALVWSANPSYSTDEVIEALQKSATDIAAKGYDTTTGYGMLDAGAAVGIAEPRDERGVRESIAINSIPQITDVSRDGEGHTSVSWEPPAGISVKGYTITARAWNGKGWDVTTAKATGNAVRVVFEFELFDSGYVTVTAHTANGDRTTAPETDSRMTPVDHSDPNSSITGAEISWAKAGLLVKLSTQGRVDSWQITLYDLINVAIVKQVVVRSRDTYIVRLPISDDARTTLLRVHIASRNSTVDKLVHPQYRLNTKVLDAGKGRAAISGTAIAACNDAVKIACEGTKLKIVELKSRKVLGYAIVRSDLSYSSVFKWKPRHIAVEVLGPQSITSGPLEKGFWNR